MASEDPQLELDDHIAEINRLRARERELVDQIAATNARREERLNEIRAIEGRSSQQASAAKISQLLAAAGSILGIALSAGAAGLVASDDEASIDSSRVFLFGFSAEDGVDCGVAAAEIGANSGLEGTRFDPCFETGISSGDTLITLGRITGFDPDKDGVPDWDCESVGGGGDNLDPWSCTPTERGPSSDSFTLADGSTQVVRISVDDDPDVEYIKFGESDPVLVERTNYITALLIPAGGYVALLVTTIINVLGQPWAKARFGSKSDEEDDA